MFQFTREFIVNDNVGKLEGGVKFLAKEGTLFVDNLVNIRKKDVHVIYKHEHEAAANEVVKIAPAVVSSLTTAGEVVRLVITLGVQGKTTATFNDCYPDHSRHLFYETITTSSADDVFTGLKASYDHEAALPGVKELSFLKVSVDGSKKLVLEAPDCYTRIKEVRIVKLPQPTPVAKIGAQLTGYEDWVKVLDWKRKDGVVASKVEFSAGKEGTGNTVQILKNMRLQTAANLNPYGLDMDERPIPRGEYDQYTVEMVTERRHIGHDVMGSIGTSLTTHVFYVLKGALSTAFAAELSKIGAIEVAEDAKAEPKQVLAHASDIPSYDDGAWDSSDSD